MRDLSRVAVLCPRNDAESVLISLLCHMFDIRLFLSEQSLGATLTKESPRMLARDIVDEGRNELWIVEIPGLDEEWTIEKEYGIKVVPIDHHVYGRGEDVLDRTMGSDGSRLPSSLEQFLALAEITDSDLSSKGFDPRAVRGIGIFDDRYVDGLRVEGYAQDEIRKVLKLREVLLRTIQPDFDERAEVARILWQNHQVRGRIRIVECHGGDLRAEVALLTVMDGTDLEPLIVVANSGQTVYVQNVPPDAISSLSAEIPGKTFTFGRNCWGVDQSEEEGSVPDFSRILSIVKANLVSV